MSADFQRLPGAIAGGNLSTSQFLAVKMSESATVDFEVLNTTANTFRPVGVLQNKPNSSGQGAEVAVAGVAKMKYGGSITQGDLIGIDSVGRAVSLGSPTSTGGHAGRYVLGQALMNGTSSGVYHVLLHQAYLFTT